MAAPVFQGSQGGYSNIATTSHSASLDATASAGDLLLVLAASASNGITISASGFTLIDGGTIDDGGPTGEYVALWKLATGGETSVSISTSSSTTLSYCVLRFSNAEYATKSTTSFGTSTAPNSTTPTSPSTGENFFQVSAAFWHGGTYQTGYPTNYTTGQTESNDSFDAGTVSDGVVAACRSVASTEDPGAFTLNDSVGWAAQTYTVISDDTGPAPVSGSGSPSEGDDTSDGDGDLVFTGAATATEEDDTGDGSGSLVFSGSCVATESNDTCSSVGILEFSGISEPNEQDDTSTITGALQFTGSSVATESPDTGSGSGGTGFVGSGNITEGNDSSTGTGSLVFAGACESTESGDTCSGSGDVGLVGSGSPSESDDTSSGSGALLFSGSSDATEDDDSSMGSGGTGVVGMVMVTAGDDTGNAGNSGSLVFTGTALAYGSGDSSSASGTVPAINWYGPQDCHCPGCEGGCDVAEDNYNRPDNEDPGTKWIEVSGDADILNDTLVVRSGITLTRVRQIPWIAPGDNYANSFVTTLLRSDGVDSYSSWQLIFNWENSSNYSYINITYDGGTGEWWPAFYDMNGGVPTLVMDSTTHPESTPFSSDPDGNLEVQVCYSSAEWTFRDLKSQNGWTNCDAAPVNTLPANPSHGLVGYGPGAYDDWDYNVHWESRRECFSCACFCQRSDTDWRCMPEVLDVTLVPVGTPTAGYYGDCGTPATIGPFVIRQVVPILSGPGDEPIAPVLTPNRETAFKGVWYGPLISFEPGSTNIAGDYHRMILACDDLGFKFVIEENTPGSDPYFVGAQTDNTTVGFDPAYEGAIGNRSSKFWNVLRSSCNPLCIVFENLKHNIGPTCAAYSTEYEIHVTEHGKDCDGDPT